MDSVAVAFNPLLDGYMENPSVHMADVRANSPVQMVIDQWALFRYDDCFTLLRDSSLSVEEANSNLGDTDRGRAAVELDLGPDVRKTMLSTDPPDHTRLRRLVSKAFTPRTIEALRPRVHELVDETLDAMEERGGGDLVAELAFPLPFDVISEMLGLPDSDKETIIGWSGAMVKTLDPIISEEEMAEAARSGAAMDAHITEVIEWKRDHPADDLLTALIQAEEAGDRLSTSELVAQVVLLFVAGHETTVNLIGTGALELLRHPEQADRWRSDPALSGSAVDELLRWVSPVQMTRRIATCDIEFSGQQIPERAFILAAVASANRDPEHWGDTAEQLDLGREGAGQHLSFGSGAHYCLGASLAKLEAEVALLSFITRFPNASVAGPHTWNGRLNLRGLDSLPVETRTKATR